MLHQSGRQRLVRSWLTCRSGWSRPSGRRAPWREALGAQGDRRMELTEEDVLEILKLFEQSRFDFLELQQGERKITLSKPGHVRSAAAAPAVALAPAPAAPAGTAAAALPQGAEPMPAEPGLTPILAP